MEYINLIQNFNESYLCELGIGIIDNSIILNLNYKNNNIQYELNSNFEKIYPVLNESNCMNENTINSFKTLKTCDDSELEIILSKIKSDSKFLFAFQIIEDSYPYNKFSIGVDESTYIKLLNKFKELSSN